MPEAAKSISPEDISSQTLLFEEAMEKLEDIIRDMEAERLPLDDLMRNFESAVALHRICEGKLNEAQGRIEIIRNGGDKIQTEIFPDGKESDQTNVSEEEEHSDQETASTAHGELF